MTHIFLVRHGTNDFVGKRLAGRDMNVHLNQQGIKQAQQAAEWLADKDIKAILSSPISRATETAQPLAKAKDLPIIKNDLLMEVDYGKWTGASFEDLKNDPHWHAVIENPQTMQFPDGESIDQIEARICEFIQYLQDTFAELDVVVCYSHADIIRMLITLCMQIPIQHYQKIPVSPAGISALSYVKEHWQVHFMNLTIGEAFLFPGSE